MESRWNGRDGCSLCLCVKRAKRKCATAVQGVEGQNNFREEEEAEEEGEEGIERGGMKWKIAQVFQRALSCVRECVRGLSSFARVSGASCFF